VIYGALIVVSAALVLAPGTPLGLLTNAVQTLAGVLLPSATVFLLLLCNDRDVLGPWVNSSGTNLFTGAVIAVLVVLSIILTGSVLFPHMGSGEMIAVLAGGGAATLGAWAASTLLAGRRGEAPIDRSGRETWRMPPLETLAPKPMTALNRTWMFVLRGYLLLAAGLVLFRIVQLALGGHGFGGG